MISIHDCAKALPGLVVAAALFAGANPLAGQATGAIQGRVVEASTQQPLAGTQVTLVGTNRTTPTNAAGEFLLPGVPAGERRIRVEHLGYGTSEITVRVVAEQTARVNVQLSVAAIGLEAVVVTALGQTAARRELGTSQQSVRGAEIAQTQRENFVNALQGRIAGVDVTSTSGVPGASSSITIRGVSSISSSNQPLIIIDGLPIDNKTLNTEAFENARTSFANRGVDFTNRAADFNSEDIETLTVLKGPEASALYGIDAANGAIVITTKRGRAGSGGLEYSNSFRVETVRGRPEIQQVYGPSTQGSVSFLYYGDPYPEGTRFYDNVAGFFETGLTQRHNLSFSGANAENSINYRISGGSTSQQGVIPNAKLRRLNLTASSQAHVTRWLHADVSMAFINSDNNQPFKGDGGPLLGLLVWPDTVYAADYLTPAGTRRRLTTLSSAAEIDNPYFSVNRNRSGALTNRFTVNFGVTLLPFSWGNLKTNIGNDSYTTQLQIVRHPESRQGFSNNGILDETTDVTRHLNTQTLLNFNRRTLGSGFSINGLLGNAISDSKSTYNALNGVDFLDPNFVSINNTNTRFNRTSISQRRLISAFGQATVDYRDFLYVTATGRNDWTSTIPVERNSFFYPSISTSFIFSDAFPSVGEFMTGKLRAAWAEVGRDARPYAYRPSLEYKTTAYGGYGYGFWGPNLDLRPEFARSYEFGTELGFFEDRLGLDVTAYRKQTRDQIVNNIRGSYATGFILFNLNGAETRNEGLEITLRGRPVQTTNFSWDFFTNFTQARGKVLSLPADLPESYNSDTWLYGNVRNGTGPGMSTMSITGQFYLRNERGDILISPTSGLPLRSGDFIDAGYDRQPDFTVGIGNTLRHRRVSLDFLLDVRKGGDVFNATEHWLTARGLTPRTLDREQPRVVQGVLRDGLENTANPTVNTIVVTPSIQTGYYTAISEELFIERDINWLRLRDVTLRYALPNGFMGTRHASVYVTGTDLFLFTNYSGMDPIVSGNTAAVGGSGGAGIDFGNFPMPRGFNFGFRMGL
jgi:TonB-linked SusC/RagA family outer membrane protein